MHTGLVQSRRSKVVGALQLKKSSDSKYRHASLQAGSELTELNHGRQFSKKRYFDTSSKASSTINYQLLLGKGKALA